MVPIVTEVVGKTGRRLGEVVVLKPRWLFHEAICIPYRIPFEEMVTILM